MIKENKKRDMAEMTSRQKIEAAFKKRTPDKTPINHRGFSSRAASYILGKEAFVGGGVQQWREAKSLWEGWHDEYLERSSKDAIDIALLTGQDMLRASYWRYFLKPTRKIDEFTYLYECGEERDWKVLRYYPPSEQSALVYYYPRKITLEDIKERVEKAEGELSAYKPKVEDYSFEIKAQQMYGKEKVIEVGGVAVGIPITEAEIWLEIMLLDPGLVKAFINQQVERARRNVEFLSRFGFRYFLGGLDFASEQGPMFSPNLFRELILPGIKEVSRICHKYGGHHLFASDGNLWPVANALFKESGIDGYFEVDRKAGMDLEKLRVKFPGLTLMGNISSWTLSQGSGVDVKREVLSCLEIARKLGGIIVGISNYILPDTPEENIKIMLEELK